MNDLAWFAYPRTHWPSQVDAFVAAAVPPSAPEPVTYPGDDFTLRMKGLKPSGRTDVQRECAKRYRSRETALDRVYDDLGFSRKDAHEAIAQRVAGELAGSWVWPRSSGRYGVLTGRLDRAIEGIASTLYGGHEA